MTFAGDRNQTCIFPPEFFALTGLSPVEIAADPYRAIVREERAYWRGVFLEAQDAGLIHTLRPLLHTAGHNRERFEIFRVPIRDTTGAVVEWSTLMRPFGSPSSPATDALRQGLEQAVDGHYLRAARALLDWSMTELAQASGLSLSTVRRLEENQEGTMSRSRTQAVDALRKAGIRFTLMADGVIAIARG